MAIGFTPKQIGKFSTSDLSKQEVIILTLETLKKLDWKVVYLSETEIIARTKFSFSSWMEEVQLKIGVDEITIKSECTGAQMMDWGKNKRNIDAFISTFDSLKSTISSEEIELNYSLLEKEFVPKEDDYLMQPPKNLEEKTSGFFSVLIPRKDFYVTPILIYMNSIVFILMVISGVHVMLPTSESLLLWGANFRPETLDGQWWRLLSSCFIHIGIIHLLMNLYALFYIGVLLEPHLGKLRFSIAYLLAGIAASATSLFWNDFTVSAGASGAIFGMYGVFLAMLTTNLIEKSARKTLLVSITVFVGFNILSGARGGIDNAAHIGGLLSGVLIGYAFYPSLKNSRKPKLEYITLGILSLVVLVSTSALLSTMKPSELKQYEQNMQEFVELEEKALGLYQLPEYSTDEDYLLEIKTQGLPNWKSALELLRKSDKLELPASIHDRNAKLIEYCRLRIKAYEVIQKSITEETDSYTSEIEEYNKRIEAIIADLGAE